ncbi:protein of unknown function DUF1648 [Gottschalkia purinilytica]|uniref:DUF1648 domain-containing protein n=1 Tax=Gottschalkia purinilytica TaxID=1503 RepID=A0A0L0WDI0_GOTPU|nr:protein of unknown function DUF1648 [Gottschalkia purinilytica]
MINSKKIPLFIIVSMFLISIISLPFIPEKISITWNYLGKSDIYNSKYELLLLFPTFMTVFYSLSSFIEKNLKNNKLFFSIAINILNLYFSIIFLFIHLHSVLNALSIKVNVYSLLSIPISIILFHIGYNLKNNKFILVYIINMNISFISKKTLFNLLEIHSNFFKLYSILVALGIILPEYFLYIVLWPLGVLFIISILCIYRNYI